MKNLMHSPLSQFRFSLIYALCAVALVIGAHHTAAAQTPQLIKDINQLGNPVGFYGAHMGGKFFFVGYQPATGQELWMSDGTVAGTSVLKDINPGTESSKPRDFVVSGGFLYFTANTVGEGWELWRTDGTADGTLLVVDLNPGSESSGIHNLTATTPNSVAFAATTDAAGTELYLSAGTAATTVNASEFLNPGVTSSLPQSLYSFTAPGGTFLAFGCATPATGIELCLYNFTTLSLVVLKDINTGEGHSYPSNFIFDTATNKLLFAAFTETHGTELWSSTGTSAGTLLVKNLNGSAASSYPSGLTRVSGVIIFTVYDDATATSSLWRTNGTAAGTFQISTFDPAENAYLSNPFLISATVAVVPIFTESFGTELWRTDGTSLALISDLRSGKADSYPESFVRIGTEAFFTAHNSATGPELWKTDGTSLTLVSDFVPGNAGSNPVNLAAGPSNFLTLFRTPQPVFSVITAIGGRTDLTSAAEVGTGSSVPDFFGTLANNTVVFSAADGLLGRELYATDLTGTGTLLLKDLNSGTDGSLSGSSSQERILFAGNTKIAFSATSEGLGTELAVSDGTQSGTSFVTDIFPGSDSGAPDSLTSMGSYILFSAQSPGTGRELWRSDGTSSGTFMVRDILPGATSSMSELSNGSYIARIGESALFRCSSPGVGAEICTSDGTAAGTSLLADLRAGASSSSPTLFVSAGAFVFFAATNGTNGVELWRSDGTAAGTVMVKDINPGASGSNISSITAVGSRVFFIANDGVSGQEVYVSDGTSSGTNIVKDINGGASGAGASNLSAFGSKLFFRASDGINGSEAWISDGTMAGTLLLKDCNPGLGGSSPSRVSVVDQFGYFNAAIDSTGNRRLFRTDGTASGTVLVGEALPESPSIFSSSSAVLGVVRGEIVSAMRFGPPGDELGKIQVDQCPGDFSKLLSGTCGCGTSENDSDADSIPDCIDLCPADPNKTSPGACGCGASDTDTNSNGIADCSRSAEAKFRAQQVRELVKGLKFPRTAKQKKVFAAGMKKTRKVASEMKGYLFANASGIVTQSNAVSVSKQSSAIESAIKVLGKARTSSAFAKQRKVALALLDKLSKSII